MATNQVRRNDLGKSAETDEYQWERIDEKAYAKREGNLIGPDRFK